MHCWSFRFFFIFKIFNILSLLYFADLNWILLPAFILFFSVYIWTDLKWLFLFSCWNWWLLIRVFMWFFVFMFYVTIYKVFFGVWLDILDLLFKLFLLDFRFRLLSICIWIIMIDWLNLLFFITYFFLFMIYS